MPLPRARASAAGASDVSSLSRDITTLVNTLSVAKTLKLGDRLKSHLNSLLILALSCLHC